MNDYNNNKKSIPDRVTDVGVLSLEPLPQRPPEPCGSPHFFAIL